MSGACADQVDGYRCTCHAGYTGANCDCGTCTASVKSRPILVLYTLCRAYNRTYYSFRYCWWANKCLRLLFCAPTEHLCLSDVIFAVFVVIDNCSPSPCKFGICQNLIGGYRCTCNNDYIGPKCDIRKSDRKTLVRG